MPNKGNITIHVFPADPVVIGINGHEIVADVCEQRDVNADGISIKVNGAPADASYELNDGDYVFLAKNIDGNE